MRHRRRELVLWIALAAPLPAADDAPSWLRELSSASLPKYDSKVPAAVLLNEESVTVDDNGRMQTSSRYAVKILTREGRDYAAARKVYLTGTGKVKDLRAWMIYASGEVKKFDKKETVDVAIVDNDIYNEVRVRAILAGGRADPGAVFGFEAVSEDKSVFTQLEWRFQDHLPARTSRFSLTLPAGWRTEAITYNRDKVEPEISGSTWTWQLRDLPWIAGEEAGPRISSLAPRLAVSFYPAEGKAAGSKAFRDWTEVSRWLAELSDPQAQPTEALAAKARELTNGATTSIARIAAIGRHAQGIRYVSIQTGLGRGGGYRPHAAGDIFQKSYGDCKDKATLMRAMLQSIGIESYPVAIYAGDRQYVRPDWPSPQQFNHAIIAVKVANDVQAPAVLSHPQLGRLLFFDPTDEDTPTGFLPDHEQASHALVVAPAGGALVRMPLAESDANRLERRVTVSLAGDGGISVKVAEHTLGQPAIDNRRLYRRQSRPNYQRTLERWITRGATGAALRTFQVKDAGDQEFDLDVEFTAANYAQSMQGRLLVFRPAVIERRESLYLAERERKYSVILPPEHFSETVEVKLPPGFEIDEMPRPVRLAASFGSYSASWEVKGNQLLFTRRMVVKGATVPAAQYAEVRQFFGQVSGAEQSPVVLVHK